MKRPSEVYFHKVGTDESNDVLLFKEEDDSFFLDIVLSKDNKWIIISANSKDTSEITIIDSSNPLSKQYRILPRSAGVKYFVDHADNKFYCVTNRDNAMNFKFLQADTTKFLSSYEKLVDESSFNSVWNEIIPNCTESHIIDADIFKVSH